MNLAIEYITRNGKAKSLLSIPFSILLNHRHEKSWINGGEVPHKLIVSVHHCYGKNYLLIKHWELWRDAPENKLPPCREYKIEPKDLGTSPYLIQKEYSLLNFTEEPFQAGGRQHTDQPMSTQQDHEYNSALNNIFFPKNHQLKRTNWLWHTFEAIHIPEELKFHCGDKDSDNEMEIQRDLVRFYSRPLWNKWRYWKRHLIDFQNQTVAPELAFYKDYPRPVIKKSYWTPHMGSSGSIASGLIYRSSASSSATYSLSSFIPSSSSGSTFCSGSVGSSSISSGGISTSFGITNWIVRS